MVNDLIVTYAIYRVGMILFWPLLIVVSLLLFNPLTWIVIGLIYLALLFLKGVADAATETEPPTDSNSSPIA